MREGGRRKVCKKKEEKGEKKGRGVRWKKKWTGKRRETREWKEGEGRGGKGLEGGKNGRREGGGGSVGRREGE